MQCRNKLMQTLILPILQNMPTNRCNVAVAVLIVYDYIMFNMLCKYIRTTCESIMKIRVPVQLNVATASISLSLNCPGISQISN